MKKMTLLILFTCSLLQAQISFKHIATYSDDEFREIRSGEFPSNCIIDNPLINNNPDLILIVTPDWGTIGPYFTGSYSVYYYADKWIINTPIASGIPENTKFNVLAVPRGDNAFVHTSGTSSRNFTTIDHPLLNGNPNAKFLITKASFRTPIEVGVAYAPSINRWTILNLDLSLFPSNTSFNVVIDNSIFIANAAPTAGNNFTINNPTTNDGRNNLVFTTPLFEGVSNTNPTGVWYNRNRWKIFNQNRANMPVNAKFMVLSRANTPYQNTDNDVHIFLNSISQTLCPKTLIGGDREFNGNGPRIVTRIALNVVNGNQIEAEIRFTATETVSDYSQVIETFRRIVFTAPRGRRISQILSTNETTIDFVSPSAGAQFIGPVGDSSNTVSVTEPTNFIRRMRIVGDTGGNDISTDDDCNDDTRIENISFFPIKIRFTN